MALAAIGCALAGWSGTAAALAALALGVLLFFRDPRRQYEGPVGTVVAAADGKVLAVEEIDDPEIGPGRFLRVVTFLNVFDVHVQKTPVEGTVVASRLTRGAKVAAFRPDAGTVNERHLLVLRRDDGDLVGVRQIAGLVARRVVCRLRDGQRVERGMPLGVIKFGSRVDVMVPADYRVQVVPGQRVRNGETALAVPPDGGPAATR